MASELEMRIQRGDKESIEKTFKEVMLSLRGTDIPSQKKLHHLIFLSQVRDYILEEVKE